MNATSVRGFVLAFVLGVAVAGAGAQSAPPRVVSTEPRADDPEVPPELAEIVITFDRDMAPGGFSFIGGGPTFPEVTGKPSWRDARECVLPVRLAPGRSYTIGINSATKGNFKSRRGVAATPFVLNFTTLPAGDPLPRERQVESVRQLRDALGKRYAYRDVHKVDWTAAWKEFEPRLTGAKSARGFAVVAGEMLSATKDPHIWLVEGGEIVPAFRREVTPNARAESLPERINGWSQPHPMIAFGTASPDTGYIAIHSWERKHAPQLLDAAFAALADLRALPSLIIDVRLNSGGDETLARAFAGCFVRERAVYARHATLDPSSPDGFSAPADRWIEPTPDRPAYEGRVVVLMGPENMSSAEAFLLMMKRAPDCQLVGARTYGSSGNPQPHALANGVTVHLPSWKALLPDGALLELAGIAPDVAVATDPGGPADRDPVLDKAINLLRKYPGDSHPH